MKFSSFIATLLVAPIIAFQPTQLHRVDTTCFSQTCLNALSRRDLLSSMPAAVATTGAILIPWKGANAADDASTTSSSPTISYQGVFTDPQHPKGYRVLIGDGKEGRMQLQDEPDDTVFAIPFKINTDKKTNEVRLALDFTAKGGPKDVPGVLGSNKDVTTISFPDGNVWKKETGIIGVYRDGLNPTYLRVIRKEKGSTLTVDLINGSKTINVSAKAGNPTVKFDFPGKPNDPGTVDLKKNTISFGDGNVWTKL